MSKNKKHAARAKIHSELKNYNVDVDTKPSYYKPEVNRYDKQLETKKFEKMKREELKSKKSHIKNRRDLKNRWVMEDEVTESPEEN